MKNTNERIEIKEEDFELLLAVPYFISLLKRAAPFVVAFAIEDEKGPEDNIKLRELAGELSNEIGKIGKYREQKGFSFFPNIDDELNIIQIQIPNSKIVTIPIAKIEKWEETAIKEWKRKMENDK